MLRFEVQFSADAFIEELICVQQGKSQFSCPDDGQSLRKSDCRGLELDWCPRCFGIWFDRSELARLREPLIYPKANPLTGIDFLEALASILSKNI